MINNKDIEFGDVYAAIAVLLFLAIIILAIYTACQSFVHFLFIAMITYAMSPWQWSIFKSGTY